MKKAIIIGASSGIGYELSKLLSKNGYMVGITGRRKKLLSQLQAELSNKTLIKQMDVSKEASIQHLKNLINEMDGVNLIIVSAGIWFEDQGVPWKTEKETIDTNVVGFTAMANVAYHYFQERKSGHLVGISSVAAIRGGGAPAYNASNAFMSNYLQGLRYLANKTKSPITITDIKAGFVGTKMAKGKGLFWVASPKKAAAQIYRAIKNKRRQSYVTKRWILVGWALKCLPDFIYNKL